MGVEATEGVQHGKEKVRRKDRVTKKAQRLVGPVWEEIAKRIKPLPW